MSLKEYRHKRDFKKTAEPAGGRSSKSGAGYLIQKHDASRLHYDFRLELDGVLKSWAVPKGPSLDPSVKSLAVHVEDHPIEYGTFEGVIPEGQYGGGTVMLWDRGTWQPEGNGAQSYKNGKLVFRLEGERLKGRWALVRMGGKAGEDGKNWLLKKLDDDEARAGDDHGILDRMTKSVATGRTMAQIASNKKAAVKKSRRVRRPKEKTRTAERPDQKIRRRSAEHSHDVAAIEGARRSAMPGAIAPELPLLVENAPQGADWLYELKLDGYRTICFVKRGKAVLFTRRGHDWTHRFPTVADAVAGLGLENAILDGEIVALKADGTSDFQALQNILKHGGEDKLIFFVFDLLYLGGHDLRQVALIERKRLLSRLVARGGGRAIVRYNDHISGQGDQVLSSACGHGLEGVVAKRADSHYIEGRTSDWVKVKCLKRQEFVIGGWTEPTGGRAGLGAVLLGYYRKPSELVYCGRVGTGFTQQSLHDLHQELRAIEQPKSPFHEALSGVAARGMIHWAKPRLIAEVAFAAWTSDGILRHASFQGIREDKEPREITRELPADASAADENEPANGRGSRRPTMTRAQKTAAKTPANADEYAGVRLTHPDRILFPDDGITKRDLAEYYTAVAPFILPHVADRPLSLVRCPDGSGKGCFFQKHPGETMPDAVRGIAIEERGGEAQSIVIDDLAGLIALVQMSVLEIHPWGSRADQIDRPDRLVFDIDPAEDLGWADVVRAARDVKERLASLGLETFVRTTGGKGLHVVAPVARRTSWPDLKAFARSFADALVRDQPQRYIAQSSKAKRAGKLFLDYLRNERGATAVASYSTRARPGATVSTPLSWDELSASLRADRFNTRTVPDRLRKLKDDPWRGFFEARQAITKSMQSQVEKW